MRQIKYKLLLSFLVLWMISIVTIIVYVNRYFEGYYQQELETIVQTIGRNASQALRFPLFHSDYNQMEKIVRPLVQKDFSYVIIFDHRLKSVAFVEDVGGLLKDLKYQKEHLSNNETVHQVKYNLRDFNEYHFPIKFVSDLEPSGCVVIGISAGLIKEKLDRVRNRIALVGIISFFISAALIYFFASLITAPLKKLSAGISNFSSGNYDQRVNVKSRDEVGELAQSFNQMAETISKQFKDIEKYSKELEIMVENRTEALVKTMQELNQKEKELLKKEKLEGLRNLVNSISHEINNPLTIIYGNLQFLKAKGTKEEIERRLPQIETSIERINNLLKDMMFFSSLREITMNSFSAAVVIDDLIKKNIPAKINVKVEDSINELIFANEIMMAMVFKNILDNSVQELEKASAANPEIQVELRKEKDKYHFVFRDNGPGAAQPEKVFEPFFTTHPEKRGLGLTYVSYIVDLHDGKIEARNLQPGFEIRLIIPKLI